MIINIEFLKNSKVLVGGVEKEIKEVTYKDETGSDITATIWRFDKDNAEFPGWAYIAPGSTIEANPWTKPGSDKITLYAPKPSVSGGARGSGIQALKYKSIATAQERKEKSIHAAQDRAALMWAKYGACQLVANHPSYKFNTQDQIIDLIEDLATKIYNMEPNTPFNG